MHGSARDRPEPQLSRRCKIRISYFGLVWFMCVFRSTASATPRGRDTRERERRKGAETKDDTASCGVPVVGIIVAQHDRIRKNTRNVLSIDGWQRLDQVKIRSNSD